MNRKEVENEIAREFTKRKRRALNRNALNALFNALPDPIESLSRIFLGREDALEAEKVRIKQDIMLNTICKIDDKISYAIDKAIKQRDIRRIISGEIEASGYDVDEVIGVLIKPDAGTTELKRGTHIKTSGTRTKRVVGLQVGDDLEPKGG